MKANNPCIILFAGLFIISPVFVQNAHSQTRTWDGGGSNNNWSTTANWDGLTPLQNPSTGVALVFTGATRLTPNNDVATQVVNAINFNAAASAFILTGNQITLKTVDGSNHGIRFSGNPSALITQTINNNINAFASVGGIGIPVATRANGNITFNGNLLGAGSLVKDNLGTLSVFGVASYTGETRIQGGTIKLGANSALATTKLTFDSSSLTSLLELDLAGKNQAFAGISFIGSFSGPASSQVIKVSDSIGGGVLKLTSDIFSNLGSVMALAPYEIAATLDLNGVTRNAIVTNQELLISGNIINSGAAGAGFTASSSGRVTLSGTNTYDGLTKIDSGKLALSVNGSLLDSGAVQFTGNGGNLDISGITAAGETVGSIETVGGINNSLVLGSKVLTVGGTNATTTFSGGSGGSGGITKNGTGTFTLTDNQAYTGVATVTDGKLVLNAARTFATGSVNVAGGELNINGTITTGNVAASSVAKITGSGVIGGAVTANATSFIQPGNGGAGNLTMNNGLSLAGTYSWDLVNLSVATAGTDFDRLSVTAGNVDIMGANLGLNLGILAPSSNVFWAANKTWAGILNNTGAGSLTGNFAPINNAAWSSFGTFTTQNVGNDVNLVWTVIPEPNSELLFLAGLSSLAMFRRRNS
jgi:fibronectin-binding autotransporter adhesin